MVEFFFQFVSQTFLIFWNFSRALARQSNRHLATVFKSVPCSGKRFCSPKKVKPRLNQPTNADAMSCWSNSIRIETADRRQRDKQKIKWKTSLFVTSHRRA